MPRPTPHDRLIRWLLRLLPFDVRESHGHEMRQVLRAQRHDLTPRRLAAARFWLAAATDIVRVAPRHHADALAQDLRYTARGLRRAPGFAAAAVTTIALGTGAIAAVFAVVSAVLLRPLPYPDASRLALVWATTPEGTRTWLSPPELDDLRRRATTVDAIAGLSDIRLGLTGAGAPEELQIVAASASLFPMLGATPAAGRLLSEDDDRENAPLTVVLSHALWRRRFGGSHAVVGTRILLDGRAYTVAGVLAPSFSVPPPSSVFPARADAWVALRTHLPAVARDIRYLHAMARVRRGVSIDAAGQELAAIGAVVSRDYGGAYGGRAWSFTIVRMQDDLVRHIRPALLVLFGTVTLVLLIACANVAALLLARGESRRREMAVRAALGASRSRILRQLLTEGSVLALLGGAAGLALAAVAPAIAALPPLSALPRFAEVSIDWRVLAFAMAMAMATALVFALAPAIELSSSRLRGYAASARQASGLRGGRTTRTTAYGRALAGFEIALASMVLAVALLLASTFARLLDADPGFRTAGVVSLRISLPPKYRGAPDITRFYDAALEQARRIPAMDSVAAVTQLPLSGALLGSSFTTPAGIDGRGDPQRTDADLRGITPDYFRVLSIPLLEGRGFTPADTADTPPVAIIDDTLARRLWKNRSAIGQRIRWIRRPDAAIEIVGVVRAVRHRGLDQPAQATVYRPHTQYARNTMVIVGRAVPGADAGSAARLVAAAVQSIDPDQPIADVRTLDSLVTLSLAQPGFGASLGAALGILALALTAVGVYGLFAFAVTQRTREMGLRLALGATPQGVLRLVMVEGTFVAAGGVAAGLAGAALAARWIRSLLPETTPPGVAMFAVAAAVTLAAALLACWIPARRAAALDPASVLRSE
jgi:predicted permease